MSSGRRRGHYDMTIERVRASTHIAAPAKAVFAVIADPASMATAGSARQSTPGHSLIRPDVPDGDVARQPSERQLRDDQPSGRVRSAASDLLDSRARTSRGGRRKAQFGGWTRRYDLVALEPSRAEVTLTYDWTAVTPFPREHITFPPFPMDRSPTRCATWPSWLVQRAAANDTLASRR